MDYITIKNWQKFQHYKDRKPPWIKLYRDLLDRKEWRDLSDLAARLLIELWLLACEDSGNIKGDITQLAWRLRYDSKMLARIEAALQELVAQGFITIDSTPLASGQHDATPETEKEKETEKETDTCSRIAKDFISKTSKALDRKLITTTQSTTPCIRTLLGKGITPEKIEATIEWLCTKNLTSGFTFEVQSGKSLLSKWDRIQEAISRGDNPRKGNNNGSQVDREYSETDSPKAKVFK